MHHAETIVAPVTGMQRAAVAWVRLSGPEAWAIASRVFDPWPAEPESHRAYHGAYSTGDEGLAMPFPPGRGYTGEEAVELSLHGSPASVRALVQACLATGARMADPGEFTLRAFLNGRIDLSEADGVRETVEAATDAQLRAANALRQGRLREEVSALRERLAGVLAAVEASVDFGEEVGEFDRARGLAELAGVAEALERLKARASAGAVLRAGLRIAIVGRPNVGKSSLLNALAGSERAIVTDLPGTTRDALEVMCDLGGVPCLLTDTAGVRDTDDPVERIGVEIARRSAGAADRVWLLYDAAEGWTPEDQAVADEVPDALVVAAKADLRPEVELGTPVSSKTGLGLGALEADAAAALESRDPADLFVGVRHAPLVREALEAVRRAAATLDTQLPDDLASVDLREAISALGEITGETASAELLERIFRDFCIGK